MTEAKPLPASTGKSSVPSPVCPLPPPDESLPPSLRVFVGHNFLYGRSLNLTTARGVFSYYPRTGLMLLDGCVYPTSRYPAVRRRLTELAQSNDK